MIYLDTSVVLAHLLGEGRAPLRTLWDAELVSSRLLEYELWVRIHARGLQRSHGDAVQSVLGVVNLLELSPPVLTRALQPFPAPVPTLDALHLASMELLLRSGQSVELASYDDRMNTAARALGVGLSGAA